MVASPAASGLERWPGRESPLRIYVDVASPACQMSLEIIQTTNRYVKTVLVPTPLNCTHAVLDAKLPRLNLPLRDHLERLDENVQVVNFEWLKSCLFEDRTVAEAGYRLGPSAGELTQGVNGKGKERDDSRSVSGEGDVNGHKRRRTADLGEDRDLAKRSRPPTAEPNGRSERSGYASHQQTSSLPAAPAVSQAGPSSSSQPLPPQTPYTEQELADWCDIRVRFSHRTSAEQQNLFIQKHPGRTVASVRAWNSSAAWKDRIDAQISALCARRGVPMPSPAPTESPYAPTDNRAPTWARWSDQEDRDLAYCLATRGRDSITQVCLRFVAEYSPSRTVLAVNARCSGNHRPRLDAMAAGIMAEEEAKRNASQPARPPQAPTAVLTRPSPAPIASPYRVPAHLMTKTLNDLYTSPVAGPSQPRSAPRPSAVDTGLAMLHSPVDSAPPPPKPASEHRRPAVQPPALSAETIDLGMASLFAPVASGSASRSRTQHGPPVATNGHRSESSSATSPSIKRSKSPSISSPRPPNPFSREPSSRLATPNQPSPHPLSHVSAPPTSDELGAYRAVGGPPPACLRLNPSDPFCHLCGVVGARRYERVKLDMPSGQSSERVCADCAVFMMEQSASVGPARATELACRKGKAKRAAKVKEIF